MTVFKRAEPVPGNSQKVTYVKYKELKQGQLVVIGKYVSMELVPAMDTTKPHVPKHTFETEEGITILNSSKDLNEKLEKLNFGDYLEVIFLNKKKVKTKEGHTIFPYEFEVIPLTLEDGQTA